MKILQNLSYKEWNYQDKSPQVLEQELEVLITLKEENLNNKNLVDHGQQVKKL